MTPACPNCNALVPWARDGASEAQCATRDADDCPVDICSKCAAFYSCEDGYDDDGQGVRTVARCHPCEDVRQAARFANSADPRLA